MICRSMHEFGHADRYPSPTWGDEDTVLERYENPFIRDGYGGRPRTEAKPEPVLNQMRQYIIIIACIMLASCRAVERSSSREQPTTALDAVEATEVQAVALNTLLNRQLPDLHHWPADGMFCVAAAEPGGKTDRVGPEKPLFSDPRPELLGRLALPGRLVAESRCPVNRPPVVHLRVSTPEERGGNVTVDTDYICGGSCGKGFRLRMRRAGAEWVVSGSSLIWTS
jgi:hypothetical protein